MGLITGYICLICFILLLAKYIARKSKKATLNRFFAKIHKPVSTVLILMVIVHFILVIPVLRNRNLWMNLSGVLSFILIFGITILCHTLKNGKQRIKWHRILSATMLIVTILHIVLYFIDFNQYQQKMKNTEIADVDVAHLADGEYIGSYNVGYIYAKVKVIVKDGAMEEVQLLEHRNEHGARAEALVDEIVKKQKITVDSVSGASNSSRVIKKACENALKGSPQK